MKVSWASVAVAELPVCHAASCSCMRCLHLLCLAVLCCEDAQGWPRVQCFGQGLVPGGLVVVSLLFVAYGTQQACVLKFS